MPPVSVTMQPVKLAFAALVDDGDADGALVVLLPHAAASSAAAAQAATEKAVFRTVVPPLVRFSAM
jgi:hypothetical protein